MSNLTRYSLQSYVDQDDIEWDLFPKNDGKWVKFDDIKEFLKPAHNTGSPEIVARAADDWFSVNDTSTVRQAFIAGVNWAQQLRAGA